MRILLVEDEKKIAGFLKKGLEEENFSLDVVSDGKEAVEYARTADYDCIILDILLPSMNGIQVCRELRKEKVASPILLLSALGTTEDKILGLNSGADDYLTKPFAFTELIARVHALIRRKSGVLKSKLTISDLEVDLYKRTVFRNGIEIELTNKEFAILEYFMFNQGRVLTRRMILEHVWDYQHDTGSNVIDVHINMLRNKIDKNYPKKLIQTVRGSGYLLKSEDENG